MKKIITDTNIWYSITQEQVDEISKTFKLTLPITVLSELYTSPNMHKSSESLLVLKKAVRMVLYNARFVDLIHFDPFEFILSDVKTDLKPTLSVAWYLNEFEFLIKLDYDKLKSTHPKRFDISGLSNYVNKQSIEYKKRVDADKISFKKLDTRKFTENYILKLANDNLQSLNSSFPIIPNLDYEKYELLINTFDDLLREISKSGKKIRNNDWIDMFNLAYVNNGDLYWTNEKSIIKSIQNVGLNHYLFQPVNLTTTNNGLK